MKYKSFPRRRMLAVIYQSFRFRFLLSNDAVDRRRRRYIYLDRDRRRRWRIGGGKFLASAGVPCVLGSKIFIAPNYLSIRLFIEIFTSLVAVYFVRKLICCFRKEKFGRKYPFN